MEVLDLSDVLLLVWQLLLLNSDDCGAMIVTDFVGFGWSLHSWTWILGLFYTIVDGKIPYGLGHMSFAWKAKHDIA